MHMPVMDHRIVANLKADESGWVSGRAFVVGERTSLLNGLAHVYPTRRSGANIYVTRLPRFSLRLPGYGVDWYASDVAENSHFYHVSANHVAGAQPVNIE